MNLILSIFREKSKLTFQIIFATLAKVIIFSFVLVLTVLVMLLAINGVNSFTGMVAAAICGIGLGVAVSVLMVLPLTFRYKMYKYSGTDVMDTYRFLAMYMVIICSLVAFCTSLCLYSVNGIFLFSTLYLSGALPILISSSITEIEG